MSLITAREARAASNEANNKFNEQHSSKGTIEDFWRSFVQPQIKADMEAGSTWIEIGMEDLARENYDLNFDELETFGRNLGFRVLHEGMTARICW
jgi:hypothetical protein